ncbi:nucleoside phosphorylase [Mesotoga prima]|nr:nucleoside phosphorylase [Mesotoga prima]MCB1223455.1 nucleoside phosphorylase [Mesotoga sp.]CCU84202.1 Purine or other phosphorylase family 1 [Mesotoga infera]HNQ70320.1 nucleoside phosphorylase [Mesotoga prima]HNS75230.1 nucleoside phosphorylase [Mesotoga prima]HOP37817.1 nucleoside phosphorylase [Mesotoga prima]
MEDYREPVGLEGRFQYHIECRAGDIAPVVIVPGDQGRVDKIVAGLSETRKIAENRGLITYTGKYKDYPVSVTSTGMGGPSASIVYEELINVGARVLIRIGSVAGLQEHVNEGDIVVPYGCVRDDGASNYYVPANFPAVPSPDVYSSLTTSARERGREIVTGINWTHSCFYKRDPEYFQSWSRRRIVSLEMEASALFVISYLRNVKAGFIGICYANRYKQSAGTKVDLSVKNPRRDVIENSVKEAIEITLTAIKKMYDEDLV